MECKTGHSFSGGLHYLKETDLVLDIHHSYCYLMFKINIGQVLHLFRVIEFTTKCWLHHWWGQVYFCCVYVLVLTHHCTFTRALPDMYEYLSHSENKPVLWHWVLMNEYWEAYHSILNIISEMLNNINIKLKYYLRTLGKTYRCCFI